MQKQPQEKFCKKAVLQNFAIFAGKHLCWRLSSIKNIAKNFQSTYFEEHLQTVASENVHEIEKS